jgi:hypothetical protein
VKGFGIDAVPSAATRWYYRTPADPFLQRLPEEPLALQLDQIVGQIEELDLSLGPA